MNGLFTTGIYIGQWYGSCWGGITNQEMNRIGWEWDGSYFQEIGQWYGSCWGRITNQDMNRIGTGMGMGLCCRNRSR
jgi:hypothetical protein